MDPLSGEKPSSSCTFRLDVTSPGAGKLKDAVKAKLAEFMGSYTDDVLAEYVVVLVGHGKRRAQAIADLEAFLGEQSEAFVTWLWDHLSANEASYVVQPPSRVTEVLTEAKRKSSKVVESKPVPTDEEAVSQRGPQATAVTSVNDTGRKVHVKSTKEPVIEATQELPSGRPKSGSHTQYGDDQGLQDVAHDRHDQPRPSDAKRTRSPEPWSRRRRGFLEDKLHPKSDSSPPRVRASRRLLETAVRDAVGPAGMSISSGSASRRTERVESRLLESAMRDAVGPAAVASVNNGIGVRRSDRTESRLVESAGRDVAVSTGMPVGISARRTESRLLDSAVRDAVGQAGVSGNSINPSRRTESGLKRLRSVVSADVDPSAPDANGRHHHLKPRLDISKQGSKILPAMAVALKAAAAAAEDVNNTSMKGRGRSMGSVWDRLGNRMSERLGVKEIEFQDLGLDADNGELDDRWEDSKFDVVEESRMGNRQKWRKISERTGKAPREDEDDTVMVPDQSPSGTYLQGKRSAENKWQVGSIKDSEAYDGGDVVGDAVNDEDEGILINVGTGEMQEHGPGKAQESVSLQFGNAPSEKRAAHGVQQSNTSAAINPLSKVPNIHINANVRSLQSKDTDPSLKVPHDVLSQLPKRGAPLDKPAGPSPTGVDTNDVLEMKKRMRQVQLEMTKLRAKQAEVTKEVQKVGSGPISGLKARSQEEVDAHSVCVTNIHFAATKEIIAAHFGNCGDVVRVTVLTDNGKPKGSAYVEFLSKDGVDKALNLNDSSLLSRSLKVVRKDSSELVAAPAATGRPSHGPPFVSVRAPTMGKFLRKTGLSLRRPSSLARPFPGTTHLQWKRETAPPGGSNGSPNFGHTNGLSITPGGRIAALRSPTSLMGDRYGLGPIRLTRSMSYVRPTPYPPRQTLPAVQEQKVAN